MTKQQGITILLVVSIVLNMVLVSVLIKDHKEDERINRVLISRGDQAIDKAVNTSGIVVSDWEELSVEELVFEIGQVEKEFVVATEVMSIANSYFLPTKVYSQQSRYFIQKLVEEGKTEELYEEYYIENLNMRHMWKFLAENQIIELGIDEVRTRWEDSISIDISHMEVVIHNGDTSPSKVIEDDPNADFLVLNGIVYMNVKDVQWVMDAELSKGDLIGEIERTGIIENFENWDATMLGIGNRIYGCNEEKMLVLVEVKGELIPYMKWIEG